MRRIVDFLRLLHGGGLSHREVARVVKSSPTTVGEILRRAKLVGVTWPLPAGVSELWLEAQLYPPVAPSSQLRPEPDWPSVHRELPRKGAPLPKAVNGVSRADRLAPGRRNDASAAGDGKATPRLRGDPHEFETRRATLGTRGQVTAKRSIRGSRPYLVNPVVMQRSGRAMLSETGRVLPVLEAGRCAIGAAYRER